MLIQPSDLVAFGVQPDDHADVLIATMIESASSAITDAAGCPILKRTSTIVVLGVNERILDLPGLPIREVHNVTCDGVPVTDFKIATSGLYRARGWATSRDLPEVEITYTHGYDTVPADIKSLCAAMTIAGINAVSDQAFELLNGARSSIAIDDYRESFATTGEGLEQVTPMSLPQRTRAWLSERFGSGARVLRTL